MSLKSQLETWTHQGSITNSKKSYNAIDIAFDVYDWPDALGPSGFKTFLQGSYKNNTNIYGDSDVDVIIQMGTENNEGSWFRDISNLSKEEKSLYLKNHSSVSYKWKDFYSDVFNALNDYFGTTNVSAGNKSIKVNTSYLPTDVVVATQYRLYTSYKGKNTDKYIEGIKFFIPSENRWVINYPHPHYVFGIKKHNDTNQKYKKFVRIFKNIRSYLVSKQKINKEVAPSYFIECLLFNVPSNLFKDNHVKSVVNIISFILDSELDGFKCQNKLVSLFGESDEKWNKRDCLKFLSETIAFLKNN